MGAPGPDSSFDAVVVGFGLAGLAVLEIRGQAARIAERIGATAAGSR
ncbi:hypothetical protein [Patulibacter minatonensis]|nr:hypothetical protein [Patulibacter minatonensis]